MQISWKALGWFSKVYPFFAPFQKSKFEELGGSSVDGSEDDNSDDSDEDEVRHENLEFF